MRILLDTNILIASIISHGSCFELLEHCIRNHILITSNYIIDEFEKVLQNKFGFVKEETSEAQSVIFKRFIKIKPCTIEVIDLSDKSDIPILGTAVSGKCKLLITGDRELLSLKSYENINIVSVSESWKMGI